MPSASAALNLATDGWKCAISTSSSHVLHRKERRRRLMARTPAHTQTARGPRRSALGWHRKARTAPPARHWPTAPISAAGRPAAAGACGNAMRCDSCGARRGAAAVRRILGVRVERVAARAVVLGLACGLLCLPFAGSCGPSAPQRRCACRTNGGGPPFHPSAPPPTERGIGGRRQRTVMTCIRADSRAWRMMTWMVGCAAVSSEISMSVPHTKRVGWWRQSCART
jgi:hypothetical protein